MTITTKTYEVVATETVSYTILVKATSEEQARGKANAKLDAYGVEPTSDLPVDDIERMIVNVKELP